jgi:hypothetical protein
LVGGQRGNEVAAAGVVEVAAWLVAHRARRNLVGLGKAGERVGRLVDDDTLARSPMAVGGGGGGGGSGHDPEKTMHRFSLFPCGAHGDKRGRQVWAAAGEGSRPSPIGRALFR